MYVGGASQREVKDPLVINLVQLTESLAVVLRALYQFFFRFQLTAG
jgi:hypothetical protein